jgi:hypothetical protein
VNGRSRDEFWQLEKAAGMEARPGKLSSLIVRRASLPATRVRAGHVTIRGPKGLRTYATRTEYKPGMHINDRDRRMPSSSSL